MPDLIFDASTLVDTADLDVGTLPLPGLGAGAAGRILRLTDAGWLRSAVVEFPAGWAMGLAAGAAGQQGYILSGTLRDGTASLEAGTFFYHPPGHAFDWRCTGPVRLVLILNGSQTYTRVAASVDEPDAIVAMRSLDVPITPSTIEGRPTGVIRRVLWKDPESGADTRHLTIPVGVSGLGAEWHPCNEEIFCLSRDSAVNDPNPFHAGCFLFNPAFAVHGGNRSINAAETTLLEWHDGLWEIHRHTD